MDYSSLKIKDQLSHYSIKLMLQKYHLFSLSCMSIEKAVLLNLFHYDEGSFIKKTEYLNPDLVTYS
jgi:hypothetical protein